MNTLIKEINGILAKNEVSKEAAISEIKEIVLKNLTEESKTIFQFIPEEIGNQLLLDRDPHGNVQVAKI